LGIGVDATPAIEIAKQTLLSGALVLAIGTVTGFVAKKCKIPDVAIFLVVGIAIGPAALGLINIKADSALYQIILLFGASYILFDGGASLRFEVLKRVWITIVVISTIGVLITGTVTGIAAHVVLDRRAVTGRGACFHRSGDAGANFPANQNPRPRGPDSYERIRIQRCDGRNRDVRSAGRSHGLCRCIDNGIFV
jgi:NhaP-type Na+/H+ and K+/H+ antiporter